MISKFPTFGLAEYYPDGTFNMTTFDGKPKMKGDWSFDENGKPVH
ncbi:hypothetical protein [Providencia hangzhouensis]